jgi:hypothetical protein
VSHHRSPSSAAQALAEKLLDGATCRCGKQVSLAVSSSEHCRWRLLGDMWTPDCDVPSISGKGIERGDVEAMKARLVEQQDDI